MACRIFRIRLEGVPAAFAAHPSPDLREPAVTEDNVRDITEKSFRLDSLQLKSASTKAGSPIAFSFVITNVGKKDVAVPNDDFSNIIGINYGWEAVSETAKQTKATPGI